MTAALAQSPPAGAATGYVVGKHLLDRLAPAGPDRPRGAAGQHGRAGVMTGRATYGFERVFIRLRTGLRRTAGRRGGMVRDMEMTQNTNRRENPMSSRSTVSTEPHKSGSAIFIALVPWVIFTVLVQHTSLKLGSVVALVAAAVIAVPGVRSGQPKILELGAVAIFIGFTIAAFAVDHHTATELARYARGIAAAGLAAIAFTSLLFVPFTEQYAREQVPEEFWSTDRFKAVNRHLTILWGVVFAAMVPFHILAGALDRRGTNILFNWLVPILLVLWAAKQSTAAGEGQDATAHRLA
jgi:hypothetical protein